MLSIRDVHANRGTSYVLQGLSLEVPTDACTVILGRNGMGKTTLVRTIMGLTKAHEGEIRFGGRNIVGTPAHEVAAAGIGLVPQGRHIFPSLTVEENLALCRRRGAPDGAWSIDRVFDEFPNLARRRKNWGNQLSGGEQQMLAIGRVLVGGARLVLMDEPSEGLAPAVVRQVGDIIEHIRALGTTVVLVEQNYRLAIRCADSIKIIVSGQVAWEGTSAELEASEETRARHLGIGA